MLPSIRIHSHSCDNQLSTGMISQHLGWAAPLIPALCPRVSQTLCNGVPKGTTGWLTLTQPRNERKLMPHGQALTNGGQELFPRDQHFWEDFLRFFSHGPGRSVSVANTGDQPASIPLSGLSLLPCLTFLILPFCFLETNTPSYRLCFLGWVKAKSGMMEELFCKYLLWIIGSPCSRDGFLREWPRSCRTELHTLLSLQTLQSPRADWADYCTKIGTYSWFFQEIQIFLSETKQTHPPNQLIMLPVCFIIIMRRFLFIQENIKNLGPTRIMQVSKDKKINCHVLDLKEWTFEIESR